MDYKLSSQRLGARATHQRPGKNSIDLTRLQHNIGKIQHRASTGLNIKGVSACWHRSKILVSTGRGLCLKTTIR
jgi:hypothetical protein